MLITKEEAKKMDFILTHLVKNNTARLKYKQIQDILNISLEEAHYLHDLILKYHNETEPVISIHYASNIAKRPNITEEFLNKGGFLSVYAEQNEMKEHAKKIISKADEKTGFVNWLGNNSWFTFIIALLGFILGLLSLLISLKIINISQPL